MERFNSFTTDSGDTATLERDSLNALLRVELSAIETYTEAITHLGPQGGAATLEYVRGNHREAVEWLRERVRHQGRHAVSSPGLWCGFASLMDTHDLVGMATILAALKQGEQHMLNEYEEAVRSDDLDEECREHFFTRNIPDGERHLLELDHMLAQDRRG